MTKYQENEIYDIAFQEQEYLGIKMYLDLIFSDELNLYFNYDYNHKEDKVIFNFEVDEGGASLVIDNISNEYNVTFNDVLCEHLDVKY